MRPGWPGNRGRGRHARGTRTLAGPTIWVVSAAMAIICGIVVMAPTGGAVRLAARMADAVGRRRCSGDAAPPTLVDGRSFTGTPAVGALFTVSGGQLRKHFCTASVVDSPVGDLVITAAHCVSGKAPGRIAFVPGYRSGVAPYGVWLTSAVLSDSAWQASGDPDPRRRLPRGPPHRQQRPDQDLTGGEQLGIGWPARVWVDVIGYPDATEQPITCENESKPLGAREMEFDCGGYTDGTSGGPFLGRVDPSTGDGTVIGVIGGYEQGGDIASVSYSPGSAAPSRRSTRPRSPRARAIQAQAARRRALAAGRGRHDAVQVGEVLGGGHPLRGGGVRLHLLGRGRPGDHGGAAVLGGQGADRGLKDAAPALGRPRDECLHPVELVVGHKTQPARQ